MFKFFKKLYKNELEINFIKCQNINFGISVIIISIILTMIFLNGVNLGIDFTGGIVIELNSKTPIQVIDVREKLSKLNFNNAIVQVLDNNNEISIKINSMQGEDVNKIKNIFKDDNFEYQKIEFVGPQFGKESIFNGISAIFLSFIGVFIYLCIRFNWIFGLAGILGLIHDFIICLTPFVFFSFELNISSVAALLTVIGYSINDSVVIFDRIREKMFKIKNLSKLINSSINSTIFRSFFTSFTTIIAVLPIIVFCSGEIKSFAIVVFIGILVGTYSSIFLSSLVINIILQKTNKFEQ